jgi:hypothetical protein
VERQPAAGVDRRQCEVWARAIQDQLYHLGASLVHSSMERRSKDAGPHLEVRRVFQQQQLVARCGLQRRPEVTRFDVDGRRVVGQNEPRNGHVRLLGRLRVPYCCIGNRLNVVN